MSDRKDNSGISKDSPDNRAKRWTLFIWLLLICIIVLAATVRFYRLSSIGLYYPDSYVYTTSAYKWSLGEFNNKWGSPGYQLLGAMAFKVVEPHDYTLPYLNAVCDLVNVLLVFLVGRALGMKRLSSLGAALIYSFMPTSILLSRTALAHTSSAMLLLFSFLMLTKYVMENRRVVFIILSGFGLSYAGNIHPTLFSFVLFFGFVILLSGIRRPMHLRDIVMLGLHGAIFALSFLAVFLMFALFLQVASDNSPGLFYLLRNDIIGRLFLQRDHAVVANQAGFVSTFFRSFATLAKNTSFSTYVFVCVTIGSLLIYTAVSVFRCFKAGYTNVFEGDSKRLMLVWLLILYFMVAISVNGKGTIYRLMLPMVPFFIIGSLLSVEILFDQMRMPKAPLLVLVLSALLSVVNLKSDVNFRGGQDFFKLLTTPTFCRRVADAIEDKLDSHHRLLITPSTIYQVSDKFSLYLSRNFHCIPFDRPDSSDPAQKDPLCNDKIGGVWVAEKYEYIPHGWNAETLSEKLSGSRIKYVLVCEDQIQIHWRELLKEGRDYSLKGEYKRIYKVLEETGAALIYAHEGVFIFELPDV